jgi:hypothetical protein
MGLFGVTLADAAHYGVLASIRPDSQLKDSKGLIIEPLKITILTCYTFNRPD